MQQARFYNSNPTLAKSANDQPKRLVSTSTTSSSRQQNSMSANQTSLVVGSRQTQGSNSSNSMSRNIGSTITIGKKTPQQTRPSRFHTHSPSSERGPNSFNHTTPDAQSSIHSGTAASESVREPIQITVWFHELRSSNEDITIDTNAAMGIKRGQVYELSSLEKKGKKKKLLYFTVNDKNFKDSTTQNDDDQEHLPQGKSKIQISLISNPLQKLLDIAPRSIAQIKRVEDLGSIEAESVEVFIKDINLSRNIMWTFSASLVGTCGYTDKRLTYLGTRTGVIKHIYKDGKEIFSGYIGEDTKVIFRSESAKLTVFVQLSREMWHFEENGEIIFHKLVNNLFPRIFKRWRTNHTHHSITIVLFTSADLTDIPWTTLNQGERPNNRRDYFRVVVDQVNILSWDKIMANLRLEFANFKRDIMLKSVHSQYYMEGEPLPAVKGNILEALNLGLSLVHNKFRNTDLKHSLNHFMIVTPGTGIFDVDYDLLLETSKKMATIDCSLDVISLSQPPLHIVPLFRTVDNEGKVKHCVPNWCDISFYKDMSDSFSSQWIPRCKIYELQMMGVMENEVNEVRIERYKLNKNQKTLLDSMDSYDADVFKSVKKKEDYFNDADIEKYQLETKTSKFKPSDIKDSKATLNLIFNSKTNLSPTNSNISTGPPGLHHSGVIAIGANSGLSQPTSSNNFEVIIPSNSASVPTKPETSTNPAVTSSCTINKSEISATGLVTGINNTEASALSSLYMLNKNTDDKTLTANSLRSKSSIIGRNSIKDIPSTPQDSNSVKSGRDPIKILKNSLNDPIKNKDKSSPLSTSPRIIKKFNDKHTPESFRASRLKSADSQSSNIRSHKRSSVNIEDEHEECETARFWKEITNPSKEIHTNLLTSISRWGDVFPKNLKRKLIKWKSFQSPAALPVTTPVFPSTKQLDSDYTFQIYNVLLNYENYLELSTSHELMRELIQLRLLTGFQICHGKNVRKVESERKLGGNVDSLIKYFPKQSSYGATIYMSFDDEIHRISCDFGGNLSVQLYRRVKTEEKLKINLGSSAFGSNGNGSFKPYFPLIRTRYADDYSPAKLDSIHLQSAKINWNQFDQYLAGYEDVMPDSGKEFFQMKFVIMPTDIPKNAYYLTNEKLSDEEIRVEGLRKLISLLEKGKYDKKQKIKEGKVSEIIFYTGNLYDFLNEEAENFDITGNQPSLMIPENMRFNKSIKLSELASELQSETGLKLVDRTWHFKKHLHCFVGSELVTWLVECFEDIGTREEATVFGQNLMNRGLFKHVEARHGLLDGYYFYELEDEYVDESYKDRSSWFTKKKPEKETNATPANQNLNVGSTGQLNGLHPVTSNPLNGLQTTPTTPLYTRNNSDAESLASPHIKPQDVPDLTKISSNSHLNESDGSSMSGSTHTKSKRKKFILSKSVKINVDPLVKSYRPELVTVHYDRVHNPEHCYHIRLQWLNTTTRFIDESVSNWSRLCERHGLKLVETPWNELCTIPSINPFHSFVDLKLCINPWLDEEFNDAAILRETKFYYHLYLLKESGFLLDNRSTVFFSKGQIDISYSWGKPRFQFAQYIHKTGSYFVELRDSGDFFLAPNNIHITRINTLLTNLPDTDSSQKTYHMDSQRVMLNFRSICQDEGRLREIFREAKEHWEDDSKLYMIPSTV